jgi:hypothetical protein
MLFWTATSSEVESWEPRGKWNSAFSEKEKIQCTNLFFFFKNKKGFKESMAEVLAQMVIYKQKYSGMRYSDEQEALLQEAMTPIFH